jgi:putative monooxygenase
MPGSLVTKVAATQVPRNPRLAGDIRVLLGPATVGATSGFMGVGTLRPGERVSEHLHPYSEEFMYVVRGALVLTVDADHTIEVAAGEGVMVPKSMRHSLANNGTEPAFVVFHASPLAPRPDLGHVDTEAPSGDGPRPAAGGPGEGQA